MTKEELIAKLRELQSNSDTETAHIEADGLLIKYITDRDIEEEYNKIRKWYA